MLPDYKIDHQHERLNSRVDSFVCQQGITGYCPQKRVIGADSSS